MTPPNVLGWATAVTVAAWLLFFLTGGDVSEKNSGEVFLALGGLIVIGLLYTFRKRFRG